MESTTPTTYHLTLSFDAFNDLEAAKAAAAAASAVDERGYRAALVSVEAAGTPGRGTPSTSSDRSQIDQGASGEYTHDVQFQDDDPNPRTGTCRVWRARQLADGRWAIRGDDRSDLPWTYHSNELRLL